MEFDFDPVATEVAAGTTVTWQNDDTAEHTASGADGSFDTGTIEVGAKGEATFEKAGTYEYICEFHPFMKGTVEVTG